MPAMSKGLQEPPGPLGAPVSAFVLDFDFPPHGEVGIDCHRRQARLPQDYIRPPVTFIRSASVWTPLTMPARALSWNRIYSAGASLAPAALFHIDPFGRLPFLLREGQFQNTILILRLSLGLVHFACQ